MNEDMLWRRDVLSNGIRVLLFPRFSDMTMQLAVAVEYGSNADSRDASGTAHFLEHMLAGGSAKRIDLSREIERLGGSSDFITTNEYTLSIADIVPEKGTKASHILSKLVFDSSFEQEKFELERKIILNEITEISDNPYEKVLEMLKRCLFQTHPVKLPIGGFHKTVNQLSLNQLLESYQT
ncbi:insulinase family protein, partial [Candidatus Bathyarchaeota archaeon]|nr:insulinase family protein [Candidatus Bathyarchaeota archaeon]